MKPRTMVVLVVVALAALAGAKNNKQDVRQNAPHVACVKTQTLDAGAQFAFAQDTFLLAGLGEPLGQRGCAGQGRPACPQGCHVRCLCLNPDGTACSYSCECP